MIHVIQYFNGEERRTVGRARTKGGVIRLVKSVLGAGEGWGVKIHGPRKELLTVGAHATQYGIDFAFSVARRGATQCFTIVCVVDGSR